MVRWIIVNGPLKLKVLLTRLLPSRKVDGHPLLTIHILPFSEVYSYAKSTYPAQ